MILTCSKCFGNKTYRGMGSMIIKCEPCNGTGVVTINATLDDDNMEKKHKKKPRKGLNDEERSKKKESE